MIAHAHTPSSATLPDLPYHIPWRSREVHAGAHRGKLVGAGGLFRDFASLLDHPDPRRIDLRATARDPFELLHVRRFEQKSAIAVYALIDVSASMAFRGQTRKIALAADLVSALAASARRVGDAFGLIGCDAEVRAELYFPATRSRSGESGMVASLAAFRPSRPSATGLAEAASLIAGRRKLVFVISDFLMPDESIAALFQALASHDIVSILIADSSELERLPRWGLLRLCDLETGRRRLVAMRPALRAEWQASDEAHRARFRAICNRYGRKPFEIRDRIDWTRLATHLMGGSG
jgi:uncharacterized protein (DUF58 family)